MKILVTGATGFAGSWVTRFLVERDHEVFVLRRSNSDLSELEGLPVQHLMGDVTDPESVDLAVRQVDHVFHLAGVVGYSKAARELMNQVNIEGTRNLVQSCIKHDIQRLLHFSSVVAVGAGFHPQQILDEESPYNVHHLNLGYFETKKAAEDLVKNACDNKLLNAVIVNPSTIYGPGDAKKGSRGTQLKVARGQFPFYTKGGVSIISIQDVVRATYEAWLHGGIGERYLLSGENITIQKLFKIIAELSGVKPPRLFLPTPLVHGLGKVGDLLEKMGQKGPINSENAWTSTLYHWFNNDKAKKNLNLHPMSSIEAIETSIRWSKDKGLI